MTCMPIAWSNANITQRPASMAHALRITAVNAMMMIVEATAYGMRRLAFFCVAGGRGGSSRILVLLSVISFPFR